MQRMISGIKPTGIPTLGSYLGAIKPFVKYQNTYELYVFLADLHAMTIYQNPEVLRENNELLIKTYLAAGLGQNDKTIIFRQSDVPAHNQLSWLLTCNTNLAELTKMPQYKAYCAKHPNEAVPCGILMYPSLMNADILLYQADLVPIGVDQKPHLDLCKDIADKFNSKFGKVFKLPEALITPVGAKIMSLSDPTKKMSKSESDKGTVYITDSRETIFTKFKKAVTDGESKIYYDIDKKPGISNLLTIYAAIKNISIAEAEQIFKDEKDYGKFKLIVAEAVWEELSALQYNISQITEDIIATKLEQGKQIANSIATTTLLEVYKKVGLK